VVTRKDLQSLSQTSVIAEIPRMKDKSAQIVQMNDVTPLAESFRILITNIRFILPKKEDAKVIMITSSTKGEGKTFISVNTALALANPRERVVIIGSDIRNPQLQRYNEASKSYKGLTEYLYEDVENVNDIIKPSGFNENCDFIYSGIIPPNPVELLQNGRYAELIEALKLKYKYIILDTAPLLPVTDSFLIADLADATIYVVRSEVSEKSYIEFANDVIDNHRIKNAVFVINSIETKNFGYGNTQGYGYHADKKKSWLDFLKRD
jgi:capsular exopolysaccharide synthesis family protein